MIHRSEKIGLLLALSAMSAVGVIFGKNFWAQEVPQTCTWQSDGVEAGWNVPAMWDCGHVPLEIDNVIIPSNPELIPFAFTAVHIASLTIQDNAGASFFSDLIVDGQITLEGAASGLYLNTSGTVSANSLENSNGEIDVYGQPTISITNGNDTDSGTWYIYGDTIVLPLSDYYNLTLGVTSSTTGGSAPGPLNVANNLNVAIDATPETFSPIAVPGDITIGGNLQDAIGFILPEPGNSLRFDGSAEQSFLVGNQSYETVSFENSSGPVHAYDSNSSLMATSMTFQASSTSYTGPTYFGSTTSVSASHISLSVVTCGNSNCVCTDCEDIGGNSGWTFLYSAQCSDGFENDEDSQIDYPNDPECGSPDDTSESPITCTFTANGDGETFQDPANWNCNQIPGYGDTAYLNSKAVVSNADISLAHLDLQGGTLNAANHKLLISDGRVLDTNGPYTYTSFFGLDNDQSDTFSFTNENYREVIIGSWGNVSNVPEDGLDTLVIEGPYGWLYRQNGLSAVSLSNDLTIGATIEDIELSQNSYRVFITGEVQSPYIHNMTFDGPVDIGDATNSYVDFANSLTTFEDTLAIDQGVWIKNGEIDSQVTTEFYGLTVENISASTPLTCYGCANFGGNSGITFLPLPACNDGQDNDSDAAYDYPSDPQCGSANDVSESADICNWTGGGEDNNFQTASNWDCGHVPGFGDTAHVASNNLPPIHLTADVSLASVGGGSQALMLNGHNLTVAGTVSLDVLYFKGSETIAFDEVDSLINNWNFCGDNSQGAQEFTMPNHDNAINNLTFFPSDCPTTDTTDILITPAQGLTTYALYAEVPATLKLGGDLTLGGGPFLFGQMTIDQQGHDFIVSSGFFMFRTSQDGPDFHFTGNVIFPPVDNYDQELQPDDDESLSNVFTVEGSLSLPSGSKINPFGHPFDFDSQTTTRFTGLVIKHTHAVTPLLCQGCTNQGGNTNIAFIGDNSIDGAEECDDGNNADGDGCSEWGEIESGYACSGEPSSCSNGCGNHLINGVEECDDGNLTNNDGCSASCQEEACGDGTLNNGAEGCDDGNTTNGDGCNSICTVEADFSCTGSHPSVCSANPPAANDAIVVRVGGSRGGSTENGTTGHDIFVSVNDRRYETATTNTVPSGVTQPATHPSAPAEPNPNTWYTNNLQTIREDLHLDEQATNPTDPIRTKTVWDVIDSALAKVGRAIPAERKIEQPGRFVTRLSTIEALFQAFGLKVNTDLAPNRSPTTQLAATAKSMGIIQGYTDGLLHLERLVNWAELATMVQRTLFILP